MSKRREHLAAYVEGWRSLDSSLVVSALADGFVFDDPAYGEPVTRSTMAAYMTLWGERTAALSGTWRYEDTHEVVEDRDGVLLRWKWWRFAGTDIQGSALTKAGDAGMLFERITYYPAAPDWSADGSVRRAEHEARQDAAVLVREGLVGWQAWKPKDGQTQVPRYKTFFAQEQTGSRGLVQGILEYPPGTRSLAHRHTPAESYYVLAGSGVGTVGEEALPIGPGDAVFVPSRAVHAFENNGHDVLRVLWTLNCDGLDDIDLTYVE